MRYISARVLLAVAALWLLVACTPSETLQLTLPAPTPSPEAGAGFQNPVLKENFADPFILEVDGTYWLYATNGSGKNISLAQSTDLVDWDVLGDAMPALPKWAKLTGGLVWAPEVLAVNGQYLMYYTARDKASDKQCVGVAISQKPEGKFKDQNLQPLVCQSLEGGTIDASPFHDEDGKLYLYYKNDGNCCSLPTYIYVQELTPDGLSLVAEPTRLVRNDQLWEGHVVEAPAMFKHAGDYYLFYSANNYAGHEYAVGYAVCDTPLGPCQDAPENPILASDLENREMMVIGPGHQALLQLGEQTWLVYHAWEVVSGSRRGDRRFVYLDQITWVDGKPIVNGPTTGVQPMPQIP